jgi:hypothetical protein
MQIYLRLIHESAEDSTSGEQRLREWLKFAPGVASIAKIEPHVRGGYAVTLEVHGTIDGFITHLESAGYRGVL